MWPWRRRKDKGVVIARGTVILPRSGRGFRIMGNRGKGMAQVLREHGLDGQPVELSARLVRSPSTSRRDSQQERRSKQAVPHNIEQR